MNRSDLEAAVAESAKTDRTTASRVLDALDRVLLESVRNGETVSWPGLFSLEVVERAARTGRNPQTGEAMDIPAGSQVRLRPGSRLKTAARS